MEILKAAPSQKIINGIISSVLSPSQVNRRKISLLADQSSLYEGNIFGDTIS